ncbi:MAG: glycerophosphodiester phosphodiesterase [Spirochaetales bacterium]|nr:glycerophosphodiester phosphodiesterase [Spirochaetales bacterium]
MTKNIYTFFSLPQPLLFGHRGCPTKAPENTLAAFDVCIKNKIPAVELDVQICETGELVVTHDYNLNRVTGYDGLVEETPYGKILELDAGSSFSPDYAGERIPQLCEVFDRYGTSLRYDIEIKSRSVADNRLVEKVWEHLRKFSLENVCMVSSFNPFQLRLFRKLSKNTIPTAVIYQKTTEVPLLLRHGAGRYIAGCPILKPYRLLLTESVFKRDHSRRGYPIITWVVDDYSDAKQLIEMGVSGIISNEPENLLELFE